MSGWIQATMQQNTIVYWDSILSTRLSINYKLSKPSLNILELDNPKIILNHMVIQRPEVSPIVVGII